MKSLPKFMVLYCSDGTYTILENSGKKVYEFNYKRKHLTFNEVQNIHSELLQANPEAAEQLAQAANI